MANRLQYENSPYLLQHKDNPVDWYPWGEEAFQKAVREDKPVFLSIGYSTCHWCHVMEKESFENPALAALLNRFFVPVKVDREERPDVDGVYLSVCQAMTGSGGWPASLFLTPDKKPFFAGTYFPPDSRPGMIGFSELLRLIAERWQTDRQGLLETADRIVGAIKERPAPPRKGVFDNLPQKAVAQLFRLFDPLHGGFGGAPKFPSPPTLLFLLYYGSVNREGRTAAMALHTLLSMRRGGIYDQIGGGFSRYAVDDAFLVPHFEKMLYDNALLILAYSAAFALTKDEIFLDTAKETADYLLREMREPEGGFAAAQDADSEGEEGLYYLFTEEEIFRVLGDEKAGTFCRYYGVTPAGNFEEKNILNRLHGDAEAGKFPEERRKLRHYRKERLPLHRDDKILTSWNALLIAALPYLFRAGGEEKYLRAAKDAERFIREKLTDGTKLFSGIRNGRRSGYGFLDDYAFFAAAELSLYSATGDEQYRERAAAFCREAIEQFADGDGGFRQSGPCNEELILSHRESYDGALPSGNAVMAYLLVRLSQLTAEKEWEDAGEKQLAFLSSLADEAPSAHTAFLSALLTRQNPPAKITVVMAKNDEPSEILRTLPLDADATLLPEEREGYSLLNGETAFYVCEGHTCRPPVGRADFEIEKKKAARFFAPFEGAKPF